MIALGAGVGLRFGRGEVFSLGRQRGRPEQARQTCSRKRALVLRGCGLAVPSALALLVGRGALPYGNGKHVRKPEYVVRVKRRLPY